MNKTSKLLALAIGMATLWSCQKDNTPPITEEPVSGFYELNGNTARPLFHVDGGNPAGLTKIVSEGNTGYLVQTLSEIAQVKPGFTASFAQLPTGTVNVATQPGALQGSGNEGFRTFNNMVFKQFNASFERGIYRLQIDQNGRVFYDSRNIKTSNDRNGSGNFVIENETRGYYWDGNDPWKIQIFNPSTVSRTGDLGNYETHIKKDDEGITFQAIGQRFLAIKEGKLYADVTYSTGQGLAAGMFDDFFDNVYIAVIDLQTGQYEKTTTVENTGSIAFINDNEMYSFDANGDLYILCQGTNTALGENAKIARIKAGETDVDTEWELRFSEFNPSDQGKFTSVLADNGRLIVTANNVPLTPGPTGNINNDEIWEFYSVDIATKQRTKIEGVPASTNGGGAYPAFKLDGKVILRINAPSKTH